jgi:hypothetical protein
MLSRVGQVNHYNILVGTPRCNVGFLSGKRMLSCERILDRSYELRRENLSRPVNPSAAERHADCKHQP